MRPSTAAARYVLGRKGTREADLGVRILSTLDVPLSPARLRAGATRVVMRLVIADPVLGTRQAFDFGLRRIGRRWRVNTGGSALLPFYAAHGVDEVRLVDPETRTVTWLALRDGAYQPVERSGLIELGPAELAAQLDWP